MISYFIVILMLNLLQSRAKAARVPFMNSEEEEDESGGEENDGMNFRYKDDAGGEDSARNFNYSDDSGGEDSDTRNYKYRDNSSGGDSNSRNSKTKESEEKRIDKMIRKIQSTLDSFSSNGSEDGENENEDSEEGDKNLEEDNNEESEPNSEDGENEETMAPKEKVVPKENVEKVEKENAKKKQKEKNIRQKITRPVKKLKSSTNRRKVSHSLKAAAFKKVTTERIKEPEIPVTTKATALIEGRKFSKNRHDVDDKNCKNKPDATTQPALQPSEDEFYDDDYVIDNPYTSGNTKTAQNKADTRHKIKSSSDFNVESRNAAGASHRVENTGEIPFTCTCEIGRFCKCCGLFQIDALHSHRKNGCILIEYSANDPGLSLSFMMNNAKVFTKKVTAGDLVNHCASSIIIQDQ